MLLSGLLIVGAACSSADDASPPTTVAEATTDATGDDDADAADPSAEVAASTTTVVGATSPTPPPFDAGPIEWSACDDLEGLECGSITTLLDYADPDAGTIEIAVARRQALDPTGRIGSLVLNPGGPGGSGLDYLQFAQFGFADEITDRFDVVSFDPRGVGASSSVACELRRDDGVELIGDDDRAAWDAYAERVMSEIATCTSEAEGLAPAVGTNNSARDLDVIRHALGDDQLTYVGFSYGTRLGATYAELFPQNVRALVLDGAVKPTDDFAELGRAQSAGFDGALGNFASACDSDPDCLLRELGPTLDVLAAVRAEIAETGGFDAGDGRTLTPGELDLGVIASLYSKETWPLLAQALYLADTTADGELFQALTDAYAGREVDGSYSNQLEAQAFINCADNPARPDADALWAEADATADAGEFFGDALRASTGCLGLPEPTDPLVLGPAAGAPPILVIGTTGDPATPYQWSADMAAFLDSGVLFTVEGEGHTAYTSIECVEPVVNAYLIDLAVPDDGASCVDDVGADFFVPAGESEFDRVLAFFACVRDEGLDIDEVTAADLLADPSGATIFGQLDLGDPEVGLAFVECQSLLEF